jgi:hypothetical protein
MKNRFLLLVAGLLWACSAAVAAESGIAVERREASFVLVLGREPLAAERAVGAGLEELSLVDLVARLREPLLVGGARREMLTRAWRDAFGRAPLPAEVEAAAGDVTYAAELQRLIGLLAERPDEYRQVLGRAYRTVLGRAPFEEELAYWAGYPKMSYVLLVGCIENWARRNAPGLMATTGTPAISVTSEQLSTLRLSPAVAAEARALVGLPPVGERALAPARGCTVVAPGAGEVVSVGGVYFIAFGGAVPVGAE